MSLKEFSIPGETRASLDELFRRHRDASAVVILPDQKPALVLDLPPHETVSTSQAEAWVQARDSADEPAILNWAIWWIDLHSDNHAWPQTTLAQLRDRHVDELLLLLSGPDRATVLESGMKAMALGLKGETLEEDPTSGTWALYRHSLHDYKHTPDWLNPRNWANPEMWDKYRW